MRNNQPVALVLDNKRTNCMTSTTLSSSIYSFTESSIAVHVNGSAHLRWTGASSTLSMRELTVASAARLRCSACSASMSEAL